MQNRSLKMLIISMMLGPSLIVALMLGGYLIHSRLDDLERLARDRGNASAIQIANAARIGIQNNDDRMLQNVVALALEETGITSVAVYDRERHLLKRVGPQFHDVDANSLTTHNRSLQLEHTLRFITPINSLNEFTATLSELDSEDPAPLGWVVVDYSREPNMLATYRSLTLTGLVIIAIFFMSLALAVYASRRLTRSVDSMRRGIQHIAQGNFDAPLQTGDTTLLRVLGQEINAMADALRISSTDLRRNLEQTNRDLRESLETVEIQNIELDLARREAVAASRMKSEFLANTSHELRTPLNGIIGFTKLLLKTVLDARQRDYLETIRYSAENLLSIINDILDFSKIEAGKLTLDNSPFNLRELIEDTLAILAPSASEKKLELILSFDESVTPELMGDPLRLRQVLTNLISNAIKFTPRGHILVNVLPTDAADRRAAFTIAVTDTGIGIDISRQQALFNAFTQADSSTSREFGGTGLGLAISKHLIEQMGGEIGVESELGAGSKFWFTLRLEKQNNPLQLRRFDKLTGLKIALYDPNFLSQKALRQLLESWHIEIIIIEHWPLATATIYVDGWLLNPKVNELLSIPTHFSAPIWLLQQRGVQSPATIPDSVTLLSKPIHHVQLYDALCTALLRPLPVAAIDAPKYSLRVLAVDDNATNLKLIALLLDELGVSTTLATNGQQALAMCAEKSFDLILLDIQMPELSGPQVAHLIRNGNTSNRNSRIVALTAHLLREEQAQLLSNGFDQCLTKPITEEQLQFALDNCIAAVDRKISMPVRIELCLSRARNKPELAKEFLQDLLISLDSAYAAIEQSAHQDDFENLLHETHKIHGACCYSGVPHLQQCSFKLEDLLKRDATSSDIASATLNMLNAIRELQQWRDNHDLDILFENSTQDNI